MAANSDIGVLGQPFRWIAGWQAAARIEGTDGQHLRLAFSDDGRKWTQSYPLPVGRNQVRAHCEGH